MAPHCQGVTRPKGRGLPGKALCLLAPSRLPFHPTSPPSPANQWNCRSCPCPSVWSPSFYTYLWSAHCALCHELGCISLIFSYPTNQQSLKAWLTGHLTHDATIPQLEAIPPSSDHPHLLKAPMASASSYSCLGQCPLPYRSERITAFEGGGGGELLQWPGNGLFACLAPAGDELVEVQA